MKAKLWVQLVRATLGLFASASIQAAESAVAGETQFLSHTRQLTFEGRRSGEGYFSPDGRALIFQSEREPNNPFYQIYLLDLETGDTRRVSPGTGKTTCAFFRPGTDEVLFGSTHKDPASLANQKAEYELRASGKERRYAWDYDEAMDIFSARRDGSRLRQLTTGRGYDAEAAYSPDGKLIVFCSLRSGYPPEQLSPEQRKRLETDPAWFGEIYVMNADGSNPRRLTNTPGYDGGPFFSPDGQRIIWRRFDESGAIADIYIMKLDGSDVRRLTHFGAMSWAPYFHPSGSYVIFAANKLGFSNFELYLVDAGGTHEPVRVTHTDGFDGLPVFSPDGNRLAWTSTRSADKASQLFLADWNHDAALAAVTASPAATPPAKTTGNERRLYPAAPPAPAIAAGDLYSHVDRLASDALEGRLSGSTGSGQAADYIAAQLAAAGLKPFADNGTFFQSFEFNAGVKVVVAENRLRLVRTDGGAAPLSFEPETDFRPLSFTENGGVEGEVVFAGYGLSVPGRSGEGYDSFAGLDVKDKIVLVLRYVPEGVEPKRRAELNRYAGLRYKAMIARSHGAKALLVVTGPNSPSAGQLAPLTMDSTLVGSGIVAASISGKVTDALLAGTGKDLKTLQTALDAENPHAADVRFTVPNLKLELTAKVERIRKTDRNVIALLPPGTKAAGTSIEYVIIGAHYDHVGRGETGGFGIKGEEGQIHNGADDNASGVAAVLELAAALAQDRQQKPDDFTRGVIFAFWSGEELGLIGSSYFVEKPVVPLPNIDAYVNFDMVGRLRDNKLTLQGIGSSLAWKRLIEKRNVAAGFNLVLQDDPYLPTDTTPFYPKNVPVLAFFTGSHENYHRPADDTDTLNYDGLERVTKFARTIALDLVKEPQRLDYAKVERAAGSGSSRETLRAYLGTIPDYASELAGVKLTGTRGGSPADKAGLKAGDIIVEFAGQKIANIYDYTYALDAVKIGQPVKVVVTRDGQRVEVTVVPEARK
ncbi:MAG: M20/M25/M40 family metallo-hydrolase [Verrucomicrobia bacterium]|nr:M20/M25/M40 family metallo-hydrolase [Verrucomicrobiota bacterium]